MELFVDAVYESLNHDGEELCGDKVEMVRGEDFFLLVLADGLGSGVKANILSTLTSKIIATMLANGATLTDAVETIVSTLPVCSERGVAYSTFTIIRVNARGKVSVAEFDNPAFVCYRDNQLMDIERTELDIAGKTVYTSSFLAQDGDMIMSFSDGVVHAGVGRLLDLGWQYDNIVAYITENITSDISPRSMCRKLLSAVNTLYMGKPGDDSTVATIRMKKSCTATVMVGPPLNGGLDKVVVDKLMFSKGRKIVCGGTTSQIVSRITGKELKVSIDYENPAVPPMAEIAGIDLVTEGVLTLGKCLEIIKELTQSDTEHWDVIKLNKTDGATRLARMFLEECTDVHFLIGQAINPAHQNPGMPVSLGLKFTLINDLAEQLKRMGKKVVVERF